MTPDELSKSCTEHSQQTALFAYCSVAHRYGWDLADQWCKTCKIEKQMCCDFQSPAVPELKWFHAIPNGASRGDTVKSRKLRGAQLKAEGVRKGVADTFLPFPNGNWHGLYIEMKKPDQKPKTMSSKGGMSDEQIKFGEYAKSVGFCFKICYTWFEAKKVLRSYIERKL